MITKDSTYGRLTAISRVGHGIWLFSCSCGNQKQIRRKDVVRGKVNSCGCLRKEQLVARCTKHGGYPRDASKQDPLLATWRGIRDRILDPNCSNYERYGKRGITMEKSWQTDFGAFRDWIHANIGPKPSKKHTLDRIKNEDGYIPGNLRWATGSQQGNNRSSCLSLTFKGETLTMKQWATKTGLPYSTIRSRLHVLKWEVERILSTPAMANARRDPPPEHCSDGSGI